MHLTKAKRKYRNQWIAFQYTDKPHGVGTVITHAREKDEFHQKLRKILKAPFKDVYLTFTGPLLPKGVVVVLCTA